SRPATRRTAQTTALGAFVQRRFRALCTLAAGLLVAGSAQAQPIESLTWLAEEAAPFNFSRNGEPAGIAVDVLVEVWAKLGIDGRAADIGIVPWARGYRIAQEQPGTCLFSMTVTEPRRALFAFIAPLLDAHIAVIAPKSRRLAPSSTADLAPLAIGVVREDVAEKLLVEAGSAATLVRADSARSLVRMLAGGRFDAIAYQLESTLWTMREEGFDPGAYEAVLTLKDGPVGYACHRDTDPATLARLQATLDELVADGTVERIRRRYLE
ncbi:MAG TPA: transporter substrate-binding domain-containing protein, partial [Rhodocyclaceae bacterium]|nr:transporter substrate-binding domain-containing protein [Rhodocyclaceae bacterium]